MSLYLFIGIIILTTIDAILIYIKHKQNKKANNTIIASPNDAIIKSYIDNDIMDVREEEKIADGFRNMLIGQEETLNILKQKYDKVLHSTCNHSCNYCNFETYPYGYEFEKELITNDELITHLALVFLEKRFRGNIGIVVNEHFIEIKYCPICGRKF